MARFFELRDYVTHGTYKGTFSAIGYIVPDPDDPITDIEDDRRMPECGPNYALVDTGVEAPKGAEQNQFFYGLDSSCVKVWPECYLHVEECRSGETWVVPITGRMSINLRTRVSKWCRDEFCGELKLDGEIMPKLQGEYYAAIYTGHNPPTSTVCWTSGGFYLKSVE